MPKIANTEYPHFMMWFIKNKCLSSLSQIEIAKGLHKSEALISLWCNGKQLPTLDSLILLCKLFALSEPIRITDKQLLQNAIQNIRIDILLKNGVYDEYLPEQ